jgi:hypothetical protein
MTDRGLVWLLRVRPGAQFKFLQGVLNQTANVRDLSVVADTRAVTAVALSQSDDTDRPFFDIQCECVHISAENRLGDLGEIP